MSELLMAGDVTGMPAYLTVAEVIAGLRISRGLFYKLVRTGRGPVLTKLGERTLVSRESLEDWLAKHEVARTQAA